MQSQYFISLYLDIRREKGNGKYPLKLRVFTPIPRKQKLYNTKFEFTKAEFNKIWQSKKVRNDYKDDRLKLQALENEANKIAEKLPYFTFDAFERNLLKGAKSKNTDVNFYYQNTIAQYTKNSQLGTARSYDLSLKSLLAFHEKETLSFYEINPQWLKEYETWMLDKKKLSRTTVGIYLRPLRAIFNTAISDKTINSEIYPFGKRKYQIPAPKGTKKALSKEQLKLLFNKESETPDQQKAKSFWFFSYACNGMNIKDIANLKYKDISGDIITFNRAKTLHTNPKQSKVIVYLNAFTKNVIKEYGNKTENPDEYIFNILLPESTPEEKHRAINNFIRYINQHFEKYVNSVGINEKVSTYWARHSFATNAIRNGASIEFVSEALNHTSLSTTRSYFAGFEDEKKREIANKLMEF